MLKKTSILLILFASSYTSSPKKIEATNKKDESLILKAKSIDRYEFNESMDLYRSHRNSLRDWNIDLIKYKRILSARESSNVLDTVNSLGSMGLYQFRSETLNALISKGFLADSFYEGAEFLTSEWKQDMALTALMYSNMRVAERLDLIKYVGSTVDGVLITKEGILSGMHLKGPTSVKYFLRTAGRVNMTDAYGTSVREYFVIMQ